MDFFDVIKDYKLMILSISILLNLLLISLCGYLFYNKITHVCSINNCENNFTYNTNNIEDSFYVEVKGEVNKPGVYKVDSNSIINDVISLADGFTKKSYTKNINLSKKVSNELVIYVYNKDEYKKLNKESLEKEVIIQECNCPNYDISECTNNGSSVIITDENTENNKTDNETNTSKEDITNNDINNKLVNINTSSKEELMTLNGIGEAKANAIIEYRNKNKFNAIEDIKNVSGIGDSAFEKIKDNITV